MGRKKEQKDFNFDVDILRQYLEIVEVMILGLKRNGDIIYINRKGEEILGYNREEILGSNWFTQFTPRRYQKELKKFHKEVIEQTGGKPVFHENPIVTKAGEECIIRWHNTLLRDNEGEIIGSLSSGEDVTQQRKIEERYRFLFSNMVSGVVYQDSEGKIISANPAAEEILGITLEQMQGRTSTDPRWRSIHENGSDFDGQTHPAMVALRTGEAVRDVIMGISNPKKEKTTWINTNAIPLIRPGEKQPYEVFTTFKDVTERKSVTDKLLEEKTFIDALIDSLPGTFYVFDDKGRFIHWNKTLEDVSGYSGEEIRELGPVGFYSEEDGRKLTEKIRKVYKGEKAEGEADFITKSGEKIPFLLTGARAVIDNKTYVVGVGIDQSERKETQKVLSEYQRMLSTLMSNLPGIAYRCKNDQNWTMLFLSDGCKRITGYDPRDLVENRTLSFMDIIHPDDRDYVWDHVQQALDENRPFEIEYRIKTKTGEEKWVWEQGVGISLEDTGEIVLEGILNDITDIRRTLEELRDSEEKYRVLIENAGEAIIVFQDGFVRYVNPKTSEISGYSEEEFLSRPFMDLIHPEDREMVSEHHMKRLANYEEVEAYDFRAIDKSGNTIWMRINAVLIEWNNRPATLNFLSDITTSKIAEVALRESEERYRSTLDNMLEGCQIIDHEWRYIYVNETAVQHGHRKKEDLLGKTMMEVYPHIKDTNLFHIMDECMKKRTTRKLENEFTYPDGSSRLFELRIQPVPEGIFILSIDITKRKLAENALRDSEEQFRSFVENINDIIFSMDTSGRVTYFSPVFERIFKFRTDEIVGQDFTKFIHPDDLPSLLDSLKKTLEGQGEPYEFRIVDKDDSIFHVRTSSRTLYKGGKLVGITGSMIDITERKKMQEKLIQTEKLSSLGGILSGVAHELNNPLAAIIGFSELLIRMDLPEDVLEKLNTIMAQSKRSAKIIKSLLTFAREHKPLRKMVNINAVIKDSYNLREYELRTNDISFRLDLETHLPKTLADPYQLQQVFVNMINNANDAMKEQGGGSINIRSFKKDMKIVIQFIDDGPGISKEHIGKIFDPFFTTKEVGQGTGLGLSIVYGIIEEHDGDISVDSRTGKGTTFTIELPIVELGETPAEEKIVRPKKPDKTYSILVVEDEDSLRKLLSEALKQEGYDAKTCGNGEEAIDMIENNEFDAVITDIKMSGLSGQNLYTYIQKYHKNIGKRVLFITGDVLGADTRYFFKITGNKYLSKPFELNDLFVMLSEVLDQPSQVPERDLS